MLRLFKSILGAAVLALTVHTAGAFSLLGPYEAFQTLELAYHRTSQSSPEYDDKGAPKNLGEEYRWNIPVLYYAVDQNFLDYFGSNGLAQVQAAFDAFNALPPVSTLSSNLTEFPLESTRPNFRAEAMNLLDLKTVTMFLLTEQLGLASPDRWTWCLRSRWLPAGQQAPNFSYVVIKRNFDPVTQNYSSYVNGTLYTYHIVDNNGAPTPEWTADAVEDPVDPVAFQNTAIASAPPVVGRFYTGWTRDDLGGLRYLLSPTALPNTEPMAQGVSQITTNSVNQFLVTSNFADLNRDSLTNNPQDLQQLHPGLLITGATNYITNFYATNITSYTTNFPYAPVGTPPTTVSVTNLTPFAVTAFAYTYGNLVTNHFSPTSPVTIQTVMLTNFIGEPFGTPPHTNTVSTTTVANVPGGDYYLLPQGTTNGCDLSVLYTQTTNVLVITNVLNAPSNSPAATNVLAQFQLTYFTNYTLVFNLVQCPDAGDALRRGIDKITFVRRDFDSLLGQFFTPVTNSFSTHEVTNNTAVMRSYRRIVSQPDFLLTARDMGQVAGQPFQVFRDFPSFASTTNAYPGLAGPGILQAGFVHRFVYEKVGPFNVNAMNGDPTTLQEVGSTPGFLWGSFDGTTNQPVVYPSTVSLQNLNDQLLLRLTNPAVPAAKVGTAFSYTLQGAGGLAPYVWIFVPNQFGIPSGLPPGLTLQSSGLITGTPTAAGSFTFTVRMTDAASRFVELPLTITVNP